MKENDPEYKDGIYVKDTSTNGTYVNRQRLEKNKFTLLENGKIVTGLYYDGRIINDYTSLIVRKRVREGNIGYAALIEYGMDTPMFATEKKEEQQETAEYIKNMDISSLL